MSITILSTMMTQVSIGEWGFAALVEADGHRILFDTGLRPDTVLLNARRLKIDLDRSTAVVGATGAAFSMEGGIEPLSLTR
jgi:7,8-dihydropterin-6-yl-methyl-4-(beta-D-ribofuranosyl)aminobenzene 5'-phosphate synthase